MYLTSANLFGCRGDLKTLGDAGINFKVTPFHMLRGDSRSSELSDRRLSGKRATGTCRFLGRSQMDKLDKFWDHKIIHGGTGNHFSGKGVRT
jgi:hypothetical protein